MTAMYGHQWASAHGANDTGDVWRKGLTGIPAKRIAVGLRKLIERDSEYSRRNNKDPFPPNLPSFRGLCLISADEIGVPPPHEAYAEAVTKTGQTGSLYRNWSHVAVEQAAVDLGYHTLRTTEDATKLEAKFNAAYQRVIDQLANGETLAVTATRTARMKTQKALPPVKPHDPERNKLIGRAALDECRAMVNQSKNSETPS